jgi:uncharacterized protein (TIRG00374 family)
MRDFLVLVALLVLMVAGLLGLAAATGWQETLHQLAKLGPAQIALLLLLSLVNYGFRAGRWQAFTRALGLNTTPLQTLRHYIGGFAMSVTPGRVGELVRLRWLGRETGWSVERTAPLALIDRAADLAAMGLILAGTLALGTLGQGAALPVAALALVMAWVATHPALMSSIATRSYRATGRGARHFARVRAAARSLAAFRAPRLLALALGLGLVGWLAEGLAFHLLLTWMGADIGLVRAVAIFTFATLAGGLTGAPGGLGGAEAAMIALLTLDGVPADAAIAATAVIRVTTLWFAIALGLLVFPYAERCSKKAADALEDDGI